MNEGMRRYLDSLPPGSVKHLTAENCPALAEYDRQMREETIPAIERAMKAQQRANHFYRLGIPDPLACDSDGTATAAANGDLPVPEGLPSAGRRHRQGANSMTIETEDVVADLRSWPAITQGDALSVSTVALLMEKAADRILALSDRIAVYRDVFAEITAKAQPECANQNDPERVTSYWIPVGPIHRAAGKLGFQMFNGEAHLRDAIERIAVLEGENADYRKTWELLEEMAGKRIAARAESQRLASLIKEGK